MNRIFRTLAVLLLFAMAPVFAAQTVILASGTGAATSTDVTVTSTGLLTTSGFTQGATPQLAVYQVANSVEVKVGQMTADNPTFALTVPGTYRVKRPAVAVALEVVSDVSGAGSAAVTQGSTTSGQSGDLVQGAVTTAAPTYTTAQTNPLSLTTGGALRTDLATIAGTAVATGAGTSTNAMRVVFANTVAAQALWGQGATAATAPANAVQAGGVAATANPTAVTGGQMVGEMTDKLGKQVTVAEAPREMRACQYTQLSSTGETTVVTAGAAGVFNDIYSVDIDTGGTVAATITLKDATGGSTRKIYNYPAGAAAQPSIHHVYTPPWPQTTSAANWTMTNSVSTATNVTICYVKNL